MDFPETLTPAQREEGQKQYYRYAWVNSLATTLLMGNILILYAIRNNVSAPLVAVLASFVHLTNPLMIVGKTFVARWGITRTWFRAWLFRYGFALLLPVAPLFAGTAYPWAVPALILLGSFGFFVFRAIGFVGHGPLVGEITTRQDRGQFVSGCAQCFNVVYLFSSVALIAIFKFWNQISAFQVIILAGTLAGFYAAGMILKVPESAAPRESARKPVIQSLKRMFRESRTRNILFTWSAVMVSLILVNPFAVLALKKGYGVSDHMTLVFTLIGIFGSIFASYVISGMSHHVGPRPLVVLHAAGLFLVSLFWAFSPAAFLAPLVGLVFFIGGYFAIGMSVSTYHYFLSVVPEEELVGMSLWARVLTGAVAGVAGSVLGGGLLKMLQVSQGEGLALYHSYFRIILVCQVPLFILMTRLERLKDWRIKSVLGLMMSFRDVRALFALSRIREAPGYIDDIKQVEKLRGIGSNLSEKALLSYLDASRLTVRWEALEALRNLDFGTKAEEALLHELKYYEYTTAWLAAELLGIHGSRKAIPLLRKALDSKDVILRGKSMVALARMGDRKSYAEIRKRFVASNNPRVAIHGANALSYMGEKTDVRLILDKAAKANLPGRVGDEVLNAVAKHCGCNEAFYRFLKEYNHHPRRGLALLPDVLGEERGRTWLRLIKASKKPAVPSGSLKYNLLELCKTSGSPYGDIVQEFLREIPGESLVPKMVYCILLVLSVPGEK